VIKSELSDQSDGSDMIFTLFFAHPPLGHAPQLGLGPELLFAPPFLFLLLIAPPSVFIFLH
jgi:hypothetical protein